MLNGKLAKLLDTAIVHNRPENSDGDGLQHARFNHFLGQVFSLTSSWCEGAFDVTKPTMESMLPDESSFLFDGLKDARFDTTHWSVVLAAGHRSSPDSDAALESLCTAYWYPLYAYVRRRVTDVGEAQDLTQEFFAVLLEKGYLVDAEPKRGRFRSFLLTSFKHFLSKQWEKKRAKKRGGGRKRLSLDFEKGETRFQMEPADELTPERLYEREWVITLTDRVLALLSDECHTAGRGDQFSLLKSYLAGVSQGQSYADAAIALKMSEGAVRTAVHRLRSRYADLFRVEIRKTVERPEEIEDEIKAMFAAFG